MAKRSWPVALLLVSLLSVSGARAEDSSALVRLLSQGPSFRVRARAALALGHEADERAVSALESALSDPHAAVRAAAAVALAQVGTHRSVPALREAAHDASTTVVQEAKHALRTIAAREALAHATAPRHERTMNVARHSLDRMRYAVVLGEMRVESSVPDASLSKRMGQHLAEELQKLPEVAVLSLAEMTEDVAQELARHRVPTFRLEGVSRIVASDGASEGKLRCDMSLLLMDEPERTLRGMLKGAATSNKQAADGTSTQQMLVQKTLRSAAHGAMSNALEALEAATTRRDQGIADIRAEASAR